MELTYTCPQVPGILNVQLGAGIALDLIVSVQAAIKAQVGFQVKFPAGSFLELNLLTKEIVNKKLDGLVALPLDIDRELRRPDSFIEYACVSRLVAFV